MADEIPRIWVHWGKFGRCLCRVHKTTQGGNRVYVSRWNHKRKQWTQPRIAEPYKGEWRVC